MEGSLEGAALAGRQRGLAVPAQVAVPLAVLVGEDLLAVVETYPAFIADSAPVTVCFIYGYFL